MPFVEYRSNVTTNTTSRNQIVPIEDLVNHIVPESDCYRSLFLYNEEIVDHVAKVGSVSGFRGKVQIDKLVFDMDNSDLELARQDAIKLVHKLQADYSIGESEIGIYFSGHKGFAIEVLTQGLFRFNQFSESLPLFVKKTCLFIAQEFTSLDRVIYSVSRLFRINNTRHQKPTKLGGIEAQLFKVQLTAEMLFHQSAEEIKRYATKPRVAFNISPVAHPEKLNIDLERVFNGLVTLQTVNTPISVGNYTVDDSKCPKSKKLCIWKLEQGNCEENWDNALLILAVEDRKQGLPKDVSRAKLLGVLGLMNQNAANKPNYDPMSEDNVDKLINQAYNNDYDYGCNNPILSSLCGDKCHLYRAKQNSSKVGTINILEAYNQSTKFYENYYSNLILTGIKAIDQTLPMFLGNTNLLVGRPGSGKTSLVLNIINKMAELETPTLFFSMDMSLEMVLGRLGSIVLAENAGTPVMSSNQFMQEHTKQVFNGDFKKAMEKLSKFVWISSMRGMTVKDMMAEVDIQEQNRGKKFKLIIIDHIQLIKSDKTSEYERHSGNAQLITEFAKTRNVCILGISHATDTDNGVSAKGTRGWEEECSSELICFRPFQNTMPQHDHYLSLLPKKNRLGSLDAIDLYYDPPSGWTREATVEELVEVDQLKQQLSEKKKEKY